MTGTLAARARAFNRAIARAGRRAPRKTLAPSGNRNSETMSRMSSAVSTGERGTHSGSPRFQVDSPADLQLTTVRAPQAPAGSREGPSPLLNLDLTARLPRAACCEPRRKHGGPMTSQLPERPDLEQLKKRAKSLLHAARATEAGALERFRVLPAFARKSVAELGAAGLALHDAQSVIAREHGFESWNKLREHVEEQSMSFEAAVDEFVRCATGSAAARAFRLLALHPKIAQASLQAELVLGDADRVKARLQAQPALATQSGGI